MTLLEFYQEYFLINLKDYPNIGLDIEINKLLLCFLIGLIVATVVVNYRNSGNILLIKRLIRFESISEDSAKTLDELKINSFIVRHTLSSNGRLKKIVKRVGEKDLTYEEYSAMIKQKGYKEEKIDFENAKFFIREESLNEATRLSETTTTSPLNTVLFCVLLVAIYVFVMFLMPSILNLINSFLG